MSGKRKPMSADEKKATLLAMMQDSCEIFNKGELESRGSKAGVVEKTVMCVIIAAHALARAAHHHPHHTGRT